MRHSDYSRIKPEHFIKTSKGYRVVLEQGKTNNKVEIPVNNNLKAIFEKYSFHSPEITQQRVNEYIKLVCKTAKINDLIEVTKDVGGVRIRKTVPKYELISTHTGRRTGATLLHLEGMVSKDIMVITGHKTLQSFESYLRTSQEGSIRRMENSKFFRDNLKIV